MRISPEDDARAARDFKAYANRSDSASCLGLRFITKVIGTRKLSNGIILLMTLDEVRKKIAASRRITGFTGAGISTESGIPDFRSPNGVWAKYRTVYFDEFMASREGRVEYWRQKVENWPYIRDAQPNAGHRAFVDLDRAGKLRALVTQNIDGLHQKAGLSHDLVIELHGTTTEAACLSCGDRISSEEAVARIAAGDSAPECRCGGYFKPATISF